MSGKQTTALIIIFIYMALTIVLGLVVSKRKAAKQAKQSNEDFLMAGKSLGPLVLAVPYSQQIPVVQVQPVLQPMFTAMVFPHAGM